MSLRRSTGSDTLDGVSPSAVTAFTICGKSYILSDRGVVDQYIVNLSAGAGADIIAGMYWQDASAAGMRVISWDGSTTNANGFASAPGVGEWFHWYLRCSGSGAGLLQGGWASETADYVTITTTLPSVLTPTILHIGTSTFGGWLNARMTHVRAWNAALTDNELAWERFNDTAVRTANLIFDCPMTEGTTAQAVKDYSGLGNNASQTGVLVEDNGPMDDILHPSSSFYYLVAGSVKSGFMLLGAQ